MWQNQLKKLAKELNQQRPKASAETKPSTSLSFNDYCKQDSIKPLIQDTILLAPIPKTKITRPQLATAIELQFIDEFNSAATFYQHGQKNLPGELRNGKFKIEASLDLHSYSKAQAIDLVERFLIQTKSFKCIKIIHGQGTNSKYNQPILLNAIRKYLQHHPQVIAYSYASPHHGGNGATLVKLKVD